MSDPRADAVIAGYAPIARGYREQLGGELAGKPLDRAFRDAFVERAGGKLIVDVGCGPGHVAQYLASRGAVVEGVDLSPAMIAEAQASFPALAFRVADMFELPYAELGGIVAFYAIVHLQTAELTALFRAWHRVLAPGGPCAIAFHAGSETVCIDEMFGAATLLDFVFHRPDEVVSALSSPPASRSKRGSIASHIPTPSTRAAAPTCSPEASDLGVGACYDGATLHTFRYSDLNLISSGRPEVRCA